MAARVRSPRLMAQAYQYEGHACIQATPPDFAGAITAYGQGAEIAEATGDLVTTAIALRCLAMASTGLDAPDALARCQDALHALFEIRHWQKTWQVLESVTLALARAGHTEEAAVILGHVEAHSHVAGLEPSLGFRARASELVDADGGHTEARVRGARMSTDDLVVTAWDYCSVGD
jgi:hypothetical protein